MDASKGYLRRDVHAELQSCRRHWHCEIEGVGHVCVTNSVIRLSHLIRFDWHRCIEGLDNGPIRGLEIRTIESNIGSDGLWLNEVGVCKIANCELDVRIGDYIFIKFEGTDGVGAGCIRP